MRQAVRLRDKHIYRHIEWERQSDTETEKVLIGQEYGCLIIDIHAFSWIYIWLSLFLPQMLIIWVLWMFCLSLPLLLLALLALVSSSPYQWPLLGPTLTMIIITLSSSMLIVFSEVFFIWKANEDEAEDEKIYGRDSIASDVVVFICPCC